MGHFSMEISWAAGSLLIGNQQADKSGRVVFLNDAARGMLGLSPNEAIPDKLEDFIAESDRSVFSSEIVPRIKAGESCERELQLRNVRTGHAVPALYTMFPLRGTGDTIVGYGVVTKDISQRKEEEERRGHIISEAAHRMKNTLAIVEAIIAQTLKHTTSLEEGRQSISNRLHALARAQDILTAAEGTAADIIDVVDGALTPHDPGSSRIKFSGPSYELSAAQSLELSLAIHELATNAAKYGALSGDIGNVEINWTVSPTGEFALEWTERSGPAVSPPTTTGFGSKLIQKLVAPYFQGTASHEFEPDGVRFTLNGRLPIRDGL
jgi:PAS domain S-box-containing protein